MRVSHEQDFDTHAVIGGKQIESFEIAQTAEFFTVLSSTLYSNKPLAVAREVLCNAWDAHIAAGRQDQAIIVNTTDNKLTIRDYGYGIPHNKIHQIYCVYGSSTKENDGRQTGGFGLGSKSPFAYNEHFTVDNHYDGIKTVHAISRGSAITQGKPDRRVIVEVPTTESGVQVSIPLKNKEDRELFRNLIRDIAAYGEMNVIIDGIKVETIPISTAENNIYITKSNIPNTSREVNIRYGNVIYPVNPHEEIEVLLHKIIGCLGSIPIGSIYYTNDKWKLILQAPANSISVTPSREDLSMTETTINTVTKLLRDALSFINKEDTFLINEIKKRQLEAMEDHYRFGLIDKIPVRANLLDIYYDNDVPNTFTTAKALSRYLAYKNNDKAKYQLTLDHIERAKVLIQGGYRRKEDLKKFVGLHEAGHTSRGAEFFRKRIQQPLLRKLAKHEVLSPKKLFISYGNRSDDTKRGFVEYMKARLNNQQQLPVLQGVIIIAYSKMSYIDYFRTFDRVNIYPTDVPRIVYMASRTKGHKEAAIEFFTQQQYLVVDFAQWHEDEYNQLSYTPDLPTVPASKVIKPTKPKGLPLLSSLVNSYGSFIYNKHLSSDKDNLKYSEDFDYICQGSNLSSKSYSPRFFPWGDRYADDIAKLFGKKIGVVVNSKQADKYKAEGKLDGLDFIGTEVANEILTNPRIKGHMANRFNDLRDGDKVRRLYDIAQESDILKKLINVSEKITAIDEIYINIFKYMAGNFGRYGSKPFEVAINKAAEEVNKWPVPNDILDLHNNIKTNPKIEMLDLNTMRSKIRTANAVNDYNTKSYIEICIINALT